MTHSPETQLHEALPSSRGAPFGGALSLLATLWWLGWHVPKLALKYYGVREARKLWFALTRRRALRKELRTAHSVALVETFHRERIFVDEKALDADALKRLESLLAEEGCREEVAARKAAAAGDPSADYFHLSQVTLSERALRVLFEEILPADFRAVLQLCRGRSLRCHHVSYHETDPSDPQLRTGDSSYNAHPFHCDGNPKFAKALVYLSRVDDDCGPFEMIPDSTFPFFDGLLRLAYRPKQSRPERSRVAAALRPHLPAWLRRDTHLEEFDASEIEARFGTPRRILGGPGSLAVFDGMNLHNGSRDQERRREVLHLVFL